MPLNLHPLLQSRHLDKIAPERLVKDSSMKSYSRVEEFSTVLRGAIIETYLLFFLNTKPALVIYQGCYRLAVLGMILTTDVCASAGLLILL